MESPSSEKGSPVLSPDNKPAAKPVAGDAATKGRDCTMIGEYVIGKVLGQGSFGEVKLGTHIKTKKKVAIKIIEHDKRDIESLRREQRILKMMSHGSIVQLYDALEVPEQNLTFLILEHVGGGELFDYIVANRRIREPEAVKFFRQIVSGVEYCHAHLVIHRDLKPENILLDDFKNVKINDFGLSNVMKPGEFLTTLCGSPLYLAPEIIQAKPYLGPEVDVWSLGVILFAMVTGYLPWDGEEKTEQLRNAVRGRYEVPKHVSPACRDLIDRMLTVDPKKRAVIDEVRTHPWMCQGYDGPVPSCLPPRPHLTVLDEEIIAQLMDMHVSEREIRKNVIDYNKMSREFVLYHLIADMKRRQAEEAMAEAVRAEAMLADPKRRTSNTEEEVRVAMQRLSVLPDPAMRQGRRFSVVSYTPEPAAPERKKETPREGSPPLGFNSGRRHSVATTHPAAPTPVALPSISHEAPVRSPHADVRPLSQSADSTSGRASTPASAYPQGPPTPNTLLNKLFGRRKAPVPTVQTIHVQPSAPADTDNDRADPNADAEALERALPPMKGAFSSHTVSSKPVVEIKEQLQQAFEKLDIRWSPAKPYSYRCQAKDADVSFKVKICKIEKFSMKGIKFKRTAGDIWAFKQLHQDIVEAIEV
eukprot:TRINITY_DN10745_c0_g1_i1.p1 TRINITY_DN10745_c0_g1~~TRINITY_DN10745_c0_g1_i1.p1  ORF type:complete len:644 (-),score=228.03 TRINITY_DN10745_c0_g1_i1:680-2611(-)